MSTWTTAAAATAATTVWAASRMLTEAQRAAKAETRRADPTTPKVVVIGAGFSGLCAAIKLAEAGIPHVVLEKDADVGGTWYENTYPGCACDIPAHLYSFSFELNPNWSTAFAPQPEIEEYIRHVARKYDVYSRCKFRHEVASARFDESTNEWVVCAKNLASPTPDAEIEFRARFLISCIGGLHVPLYPDVPGIGSLKSGAEMHSARWNPNIQLENKNVVVVGSAASAVQIVPAIVDKVKTLTVVQRTPNWLAPKRSPFLPPSLVYPEIVKFMFRWIPGLVRLHRWLLYLQMELPFLFGVWSGKAAAPLFSRIAFRLLKHHMTRQLGKSPKGKALEPLVIPQYEPGCKRIARSEDYIPALLKPNVRVITDKLTEVKPEGLVFSTGETVEADVVVWATGFKVGSMGKFKLLTSKGEVFTDTELFDKGVTMLHGISSDQFPNAFMMLGPNTGLGHNSIIVMLEAQMDYIRSVIEACIDNDIVRVYARKDKVEEFSHAVDEQFKHTVWTTGGCKSWYQGKDGKVPALWPWSTVKYMWDTRAPTDLTEEFVVVMGGAAGMSRM